jgi:hypothetical protein
MPHKTPSLGKYPLTAIPDTPDFRDYVYEPALLQLANEIERPSGLEILDQGREGACTGFGLAAVINLLRTRGQRPGRVSARMLYEMARRHDEWPGFEYEGSSCRGAIQGWYNMGVCLDDSWEYAIDKPGHLTVDRAKEARKTTLGAYYRLGTRISDFHAALNEVGAIYCSADVHKGWQRPARKGDLRFIKPHDEIEGGHAFAIVGYNENGFWVQNSWGPRWGDNGTALWLYEDWQKNLSDAWVLRLALSTPQIWHLPPEVSSDANRKEGLFSKSPGRGEIAGHFVHIDDGRFHYTGRYWSDVHDVRETAELVATSDDYEHLMFWAHGGVTSIKNSARRIAAMKETFKANGIYPYHFMYDTGIVEELKDVVLGSDRLLDGRVGGLTDWSDRLIEYYSQPAGRALWREMKRGARLPFDDERAGTEVLREFITALKASRKPKAIHLVGHSTGCILHAYLSLALANLDPGIRIASVSLLAPAATIELFRSHFRPLLKAKKSSAGIDRMDIYNLTNRLERDDDVARVYRKSILYLVSRAFEEPPLPARVLGMQVYTRRLGSSLPNLNVHFSEGRKKGSRYTRARTHVDFDNDVTTMNAVLKRILGNKPETPFTKQTLEY